MNPIILPPAMVKVVGQTRFFGPGEATSLGKGKLWIQTFYILPERRGWVKIVIFNILFLKIDIV